MYQGNMLFFYIIQLVEDDLCYGLGTYLQEKVLEII